MPLAARLDGNVSTDGGTWSADETAGYGSLDSSTGTVIGPGNRLLSDGTFKYSYDANGNLTKRVLAGGGSDEIDYTWDNRNRLTSETSKDIYGNVRLVIDYTYDVYDQLIGRTATYYSPGGSTLATRSEAFVYDADGNLVLAFGKGSGTLTSTNLSQAYGGFNNYTDSYGGGYYGGLDGYGGRFIYDGPGGGFAFGADPTRDAGLSSGTWTLTDRYLWAPASGQILTDEQVPAGGYTLWPLTDNQGTVRDIVTASGQYSADDGTFSEPSAGSDEHIAYTPFGAPLNNTAVNFLFGYDGELFDQDAHLQKMGRRWYNPVNERWLSQDPIFPNAGSNPYEPFNNSPTNFVDPSGLRPGVAPPGGWNRLGKNLAWYYTTAGSGYLGGMGHGDPMAAFWAAHAEYDAWRRANHTAGVFASIVRGASAGELTQEQLFALQAAGFASHHGILDGGNTHQEELLVNVPGQHETYQYYLQAPNYFSSPIWVFQGIALGEIAIVEQQERQRQQELADQSAANLNTATNVIAGASLLPVVAGLAGPELVAGGQAASAYGASAAAGVWGWGQSAWIAGSTFLTGLAARGEQLLDEGEELVTEWFGNCFVPGTPVSTEDGLRPIETIKRGDRVWAYDFAADRWELRAVLKTFVSNDAERLVAVSVAGEQIRSSFHHPYWVCEGPDIDRRPRPDHLPNVPEATKVPGRWVDACDLLVGDVLLLRSDRRTQSRPLSVNLTRETCIISMSMGCAATRSVRTKSLFIMSLVRKSRREERSLSV